MYSHLHFLDLFCSIEITVKYTLCIYLFRPQKIVCIWPYKNFNFKTWPNISQIYNFYVNKDRKRNEKEWERYINTIYSKRRTKGVLYKA